MPLTWLDPRNDDQPFPAPNRALTEPDGLLAAGGSLSPRRLLQAYRQGIFPWYSSGQPILWWSPNPRLVLFPECLNLSRSLRKTLRNGPFTVTADVAFEAVIDACAAPRFLGSQKLRQGGFIQAADASPEIHFPEHAEIQECRTLRFSVIGTDAAQEAVFTGGDGAVVTDLGKELGPRLGRDLPGLFHAAHGDAQVVVVVQRLIDELPERLILKDLPPGEVGKRRLIRDSRRTPELIRGIHCRPLKVGSNRTARCHPGQENQENRLLEKSFHR